MILFGFPEMWPKKAKKSPEIHVHRWARKFWWKPNIRTLDGSKCVQPITIWNGFTGPTTSLAGNMEGQAVQPNGPKLQWWKERTWGMISICSHLFFTLNLQLAAERGGERNRSLWGWGG
ncbi:Uncharacterized protein Fot_39351 [Forsythia ovata]|uniref:Uncharacterized protein n=1 Tax=Forsythia ovata TaxID=205694 RepID=A0ABD1S877_9LAMI